jgi:hypothetical protein
MISATTLAGTPLSCAHDEYVRRNVNHVTRGKSAASHAGQTHCLKTLFGGIGLPDTVEKIYPNYPAEFDVFIDIDRDGTFDYVVFNLENGGFGLTGQNVIAVLNLASNAGIVRFFADADVDSSNLIATALLSDLGLTPESQFDFSVVAFDNYFTGVATDAIEGMTYTLAAPRFVASGVPAAGVPVGGTSTLTIQEVAEGDAASPSQIGLLLLYRDGLRNNEASVIRVR